ncbi:MAG: hypothetical protein ACM3Y9_14925 [Ignavibacteria bacterium]
MQAASSEYTRIGLDDDSWNLSKADTESLLRLLSFSRAEERTYSSVPILQMTDGRSLYVKPY